MKKLFLFVTLYVLSMVCYAQSDFEIASSFMSKKGITLVYDTYSKNRASEDKPYSIFHGVKDKGFAIVKDGVVIGYSTENSIDEDDMPCGLKEMLEDYPSVTNANLRRAARNTTPIEPLIKTKWGQQYYCRQYINQKQSEGVCVVVAYAQVVRYLEIPQTYEEIFIETDSGDINRLYYRLPVTKFDYSKMLDNYNNEYTQEQLDEIAKFYLYIYLIFSGYVDKGALLNAEVGHWGTAYLDDGNRDNSFDYLLENGLPLVTFGGNHAYVMDGRDSEGRYHANFGWCGGGDGYYYFLKNDDEQTEYNNKYTYGTYAAPIIPNGWATSVKNVNSTTNKNEGVFNLKGEKVGNVFDGLSKGVYIMNGKKHIVK